MKIISLTKGKVAVIDDADYERVAAHKWFATRKNNGKWYAEGRVNGVMLSMHRFILNTPKGKHTDHQDGDGLNNTRRNLRVATPGQNQGNRRLNRNNKSGFKGVSWDKALGKWVAGVWFEGRWRRLGSFTDKEEAARAYDEEARRLWGEFARVNLS